MSTPDGLTAESEAWTPDPCPTCRGWHPVSVKCERKWVVTRDELAAVLRPHHGPSCFPGTHDVTIFGETPEDVADTILAALAPTVAASEEWTDEGDPGPFAEGIAPSPATEAER